MYLSNSICDWSFLSCLYVDVYYESLVVYVFFWVPHNVFDPIFS